MFQKIFNKPIFSKGSPSLPLLRQGTNPEFHLHLAELGQIVRGQDERWLLGMHAQPFKIHRVSEHLPVPFFLKPSYLHPKPERTSYVNLYLKNLFAFSPSFHFTNLIKH